jgi:EAL domain-containing protein (putative c-di-GMP-specific phosphodiesterase class I)
VNTASGEFDSGSASVGYLAKLPVRYLEIDRTFIVKRHAL